MLWERGWPNVNLGMSQLCKIAFHKTLANQMRDENIVFAMACPGHCRTDMSSHNGSKSAEEGSRTPAWLALMDAAESANINGKVCMPNMHYSHSYKTSHLGSPLFL